MEQEANIRIADMTGDYDSRQFFDAKFTNISVCIPYLTTSHPTFPFPNWSCPKFQQEKADDKCGDNQTSLLMAMCLAFHATRDAASSLYLDFRFEMTWNVCLV